MSLREVNCPHCFREVFVNTDALCPACRGNVNETNSETAGLKPVEFVDGETLPHFCVVCAIPTRLSIEVGEKNESRGKDGVNRLSQILELIGGLIAIPTKPDPFVKEYKISVRLPVCENHKTSKVLTPLYVDYGSYRITIPVHPDFIKKWKNPSP
jgi:hypothetical protein